MAWGLLLIGFLLSLSAIKGNHNDLFKLVKDDFTGDVNFFYWVLSIMVLVLIGNWKVAKPVTDAFIGLIILVIIVSTYKNERDLFGSFLDQIREGTSGKKPANNFAGFKTPDFSSYYK